MSDRVYTIQELREMVLPLLLRYGFSSASLFGSYARGTATKDSDIDVLLVGNKGFRKLNVFGVAQELSEVSGKNVDVYEIGELLPGQFRDAVLSEAIAL